MKPLRFWVVLCLICPLAGCGIGGFWMTGDPSAGKDIKPYIAYWQKEGMTEEGRLKDWMACGGSRDGGFGINIQDRLPGESRAASQERQKTDFQRCLLRAGYRYTGDCSSKYMRSRPLCGAP